MNSGGISSNFITTGGGDEVTNIKVHRIKTSADITNSGQTLCTTARENNGQWHAQIERNSHQIFGVEELIL